MRLCDDGKKIGSFLLLYENEKWDADKIGKLPASRIEKSSLTFHTTTKNRGKSHNKISMRVYLISSS